MVDRLGQTEVEHLDGAVRRHLDICGLQIAVNDAALVGGIEGIGDLTRDVHRLFHRHGASRQPIRECVALDELHDQRVRRGRFLEAVDVRDVRVIQRGEHLSLAAEAREAIGIVGHGGEEDLDRHVAIQPPIATAVDFAHPARAEDAHDLVWAEARTRSQRHGCQPCWILARMPRENSDGDRAAPPVYSGRTITLMLELYDGPSPYGQFFQDDISCMGIGVHFGL